MTLRELQGKRVTLVFGSGVDAVVGDVTHVGDETITVAQDKTTIGGRELSHKLLVRKNAVLYARIDGNAKRDAENDWAGRHPQY